MLSPGHGDEAFAGIFGKRSFADLLLFNGHPFPRYRSADVNVAAVNAMRLEPPRTTPASASAAIAVPAAPRRGCPRAGQQHGAGGDTQYEQQRQPAMESGTRNGRFVSGCTRRSLISANCTPMNTVRMPSEDTLAVAFTSPKGNKAQALTNSASAATHVVLHRCEKRAVAQAAIRRGPWRAAGD